jgi:hypothetical protein
MIQVLCFTGRYVNNYADWVWGKLEHFQQGGSHSVIKLTKFIDLKRFAGRLNYSNFKGCLIDFIFMIFPELIPYYNSAKCNGKRIFNDQLEYPKYESIQHIHKFIINRVYKSFMKKYTKDGKYTSAQRLGKCQKYNNFD